MNNFIQRFKIQVLFATMLMVNSGLNAQTLLPECTADVPFFIADLSSNPTLTFTTPEFVRQVGCCGDGDRYVSFYVTLHPDVAMFELIVAPGYADPGGSGNYNIISGGDLFTPGACGTPIPGGAPVCITGVGPHKITYSKPGNNKIKYIFRQIPKPIFPQDQSTRIGCTLPLNIYGLNNITMTSINSSTGNTTEGAYNSLLSCTNCDAPIFSPGLTTPAWIDYQICGTPQAAICGSYASCDTVRLYTYSSLGISATPNPATFCSDGPGVLLTASATGGNGSYNFLWLNNSADTVSLINSYTATSAGSYTAQVVDGLTSPTCPAEYISVPVIVSDPPEVNAGIDQTVCATNPTAYISGTVTNATGVIWGGGTGTFDPDNISLITAYTPSSAEINAGFATLTLTSTGAGGGCTEDVESITIFISDTVYANPTADPITCNGNTTAALANATGGTAPYTYHWSTGASSSSIIASAGTYTVTVYDQYGCSDNEVINISQPDPIILTMSSTNESSDGACDGSATVAISGGNAPYDVLWSNAETTNTTSSTLCYGIYTVTVTDDNGCSVEGSVVVNNFTCSAFDVSATGTDVNCYNGTDGTAQANIVSGGTAPYTYLWNTTPAQTTETAINLSAGNYTVLVTDDNGCYDIAGVTILQPTIITNTMTHTDVTTIGGSDGTATANPAGGTPGYNYNWVPGGQTTQTAVNLTSGVGGMVYYVEITDGQLCTKQDSVLINQPPCDNFLLSVNTTNVTCNGFANGSAHLVILNGTPPFTITWSTGATNVTTITGLAAGNYSVSLTDQSNCTTFQSFTITQPDPISLGLVPTNIACNGDADGTIDLTVTGGTYPYSYTWISGGKIVANHEDLVDLEPGTYSVIVTDANGCTATASTGITQPIKLSTSYTYADNVCYGYSNGSVNATTIGGVTPFIFSWTGPAGFTASTEDISGLASGLYELAVSDLNGCSITPVQVYINQPELLVASATMTQEVTCANGTDGAILLSVTGGTLPNSFAWTGPAGYTSTTQNISNLQAGNYNVTVTDVQGCTATSSAIVTTVPDVTDPTISCLGNQTVNTSSSTCTYTQTGNSWNASAIDNCVVSTITYVLTGATTGTGTTLNGVAFNLGVTTVTWTATDGLGNTDVCSYTVTVSDNTLPSISSCGATGTQNVIANTGVCTYTHSGTAWNATATDNCTVSTITYNLTGATSGSGSDLDNQVFNLGTTLVTWTVSDGTGNISTCSFNVIVSDNQVPTVLTCGVGGTQNVLANTGVCTYTHSGTAWNATASDNCSVATIAYVLSGATTGSGTSLNNQVFNLGTTLVTWTVTDGSGNTSTCSFNVIVADDQVPTVLSCGASGTQNVIANIGVCTYTHTGTAWNATASDNCSVATVTYSLSGATTGTGTNLNNQVFNLGTTLVTWTVTDGSGNFSTCSFNVIVSDNQLPVLLSCGANGTQNVQANNGVCTYTNTGTGWNAVATDNCSVSTLSYSLSGATSGTGTSLNNVVFNLGTTLVTWTATDGSGNASTCTFNVIVTDNQVPAILTCGAGGNQNVFADNGVCTYTHSGTAWNATATDNCSVATIAYALSGSTTGTGTSLNNQVFNLGTTLVTWTVTDGSGNTTTCTYNVIVSDNQNPTILSCGASGTQNILANNGTCTYTNSGTAWNATASDNCSIASLTYALTGATSGSGTSLNGIAFNLGTTLVTWTATDGSGNISTCSFNVIVTDDQLPSILSCGASGNQTVNANTGLCTYTHPNNLWNASSTDNCSVATVTYSLSGETTGTGTTLSGQVFNLGVTTVTWTATDGSGNSTTCSFNVTVNDAQLPVITSCGPNLNQTVNVDAAQCNYTQNTTAWNATATDNCSVSSLIYTLTGATTGSGTSLQNVDFNLGTTTVTWTATDGSGNTSTCSFQVLVIDNILPAISSCGAAGNQIVTADPGVCTFTQTGNGWNATASDNCTVSTLTYSLTGVTTGTGTSLNGVVFNPGTTNVTWTVTDNSGNNVNCSYTVTVIDDESPVIVGCPSDIVVDNDNGECGAIVTWVAPTFTDNCNASVISSHNSGDFFNEGTTTVTYTVTDGAGNLTTCSFVITVNDAENPAITCPAPIASCDSLVNFAAPVTSDNCGILSMTQIAGMPSGSIFPVGITTNTFEVIDIHNNISTCSFTITIYPTPIITSSVTDVTCNDLNNGSIDITVTNGTEPYSYSWSNTAITEDISSLAPANYDVVVTDDNGCSASASASIFEPETLTLTAEDDHVNCFNGVDGSIDIDVNGGNVPYSYTWNNGQTSQDINVLTAGNYDVIVTDFKGCEITYATTITQPDTLMIQAVAYDATCSAANGSIQIQITGGTTPYDYNWTDGSSDASLNNVIAGTYTLFLTDAQNCTNQYTGTINSVSNLDAEVTVRDVMCFGTATGEAQINVLNGNAPYTYEWLNGQSTSVADSLIAGSYNVLITDVFGCTVTLTFDVNEPDSIWMGLTASDYTNGFNVTPHQGENGYIYSSVEGGLPPYNYTWSNGETTSDIYNLTAGEYYCFITDRNGCKVQASVMLVQPDILEMPSGYSPNLDGSNDNFVVHGIEAYPENELVIYNRWGNVVYTKTNYANEWAGDNTGGEPLPDATYFAILTIFGDEEIILKGYVDLRR